MAAAAPPASSAPNSGSTAHLQTRQVSAEEVGKHFVGQYYTVLQKSPVHLYRFFKEDSTFAHQSLHHDAPAEVVSGQNPRSLQERIGDLYPGQENLIVNIRSVDSLLSLERGVIVQVTGTISSKSPPCAPRVFAQTFFLAVQEHGFYVLNDILRYVDDPPPGIYIHHVPPVAPAATVSMAGMAHSRVQAMPHFVPTAENGMHRGDQVQAQWLLHSAMPQKGQPMQVMEPAQLSPADTAPPPKPPAPQHSEQPHANSQPQLQADQVQAEETADQSMDEPSDAGRSEDSSAPLTYADRVLRGRNTPVKAAGQASPDTSMEEPALQKEDLNAPGPDPALAKAAAGAAPEGGAAAQRPAPQTNNCSVFVRGLPPDIQEDALVREFSSFGPLQPGASSPKGITLKFAGQGRAFAFATFASHEAAVACIASGITIDGQHIAVMEKRPMVMYNRGRGGGRDGRRDGRGGYMRRDGGGRGYGRDGGQRPHGGGRGTTNHSHGGDRHGGRPGQKY
uniref:Ras GTPase-activating protein-binding protein 1 n=1 Tax=Tetraselmis sp. GSL018 TaxID=582737 RepID=A0A061QQW9_9CHLO